MRKMIPVLSVLAMLAGGCSDDDDDNDDTASDSGAGHDAGRSDGGADAGRGDGGNIDGGRTDLDSGRTDSGGMLDGGVLASSMGDWTVFDSGMSNPASGIKGSATATRDGSGMRVTLTVSGLTPNRGYGAHIHKLSCDTMQAGGHFQHMPAPDGGANDPAFANPMNEVWLDFTTDATGAAMVTTMVSWVPGAGQAKSIIVHDHHTEDGGVAGAKLACLSIAF